MGRHSPDDAGVDGGGTGFRSGAGHGGVGGLIAVLGDDLSPIERAAVTAVERGAAEPSSPSPEPRADTDSDTAIERTFALPDLGEGLTSATLVSWLVEVGDEVTVDQPVAEVETAKAAVEVPVPFAGRVTELHAATGDTVLRDGRLITVAVTGQAAPTTTAGSGNVLVGYGTSDTPRRRRRPGVAPVPVLAEPGVVTPEAPVTPVTDAATDPAPEPARGRGVISPLVRRLAREQGLNLDAIEATGAHDVITRADVDRASAGSVVAASVDTSTIELRKPFTPLHRSMVETLSRSRREIPEATVWVDVDATTLLEARAKLNAARPDRPVGVLGLLARFCVIGLQRFPELNARIDADAVVLSPAVHLGLAAQTERGLTVPVLRDAHTLDLDQTSQAVRALTTTAREGTLTPAQLTGGTFTLNNYGTLGVDGSAAIINHPQVAILGVGRIIERPWVVDGELAVRSVTELTLAFDHRACDGGTAGGFLRFVADCVENPLRAL